MVGKNYNSVYRGLDFVDIFLNFLSAFRSRFSPFGPNACKTPTESLSTRLNESFFFMKFYDAEPLQNNCNSIDIEL